MRILITGSDGFLGRVTCRTLGALHDVIKSPRSACDLSDAGWISTMLDAHTPDTIVNCAATVDFSSGVLERLRPVNTVAPAEIAKWCAANGSKLIQISMAGVHGARFAVARPDAPIVLDTDYAQSKWDAELAILDSGCYHAIIRFGGIYGLNGPSHLGLNRAITGAISGIVPTVVGCGSAKRNYINVHDAADVIADIIQQNLSGLFYSGAHEILTVAEMMKIVCDNFLGGRSALTAPGAEAADSLVEPSHGLPSTRSMQACLSGFHP